MHLLCGGDDPSTEKFRPCAAINPVADHKTSQYFRLGAALVKKCGFSVLSRNKHSLGVKVLKLVPLLNPKLCYFVLPVYNYFQPNEPNCLSDEVLRNVTPVFDIAVRFATVLAEDTSVSKYWCANDVCIPKKAIVDVFMNWSDCLFRTFKDGDLSLFRCAEDIIAFDLALIKLVVKSGISRFH